MELECVCCGPLFKEHQFEPVRSLSVVSSGVREFQVVVDLKSTGLHDLRLRLWLLKEKSPWSSTAAVDIVDRQEEKRRGRLSDCANQLLNATKSVDMRNILGVANSTHCRLQPAYDALRSALNRAEKLEEEPSNGRSSNEMRKMLNAQPKAQQLAAGPK